MAKKNRKKKTKKGGGGKSKSNSSNISTNNNISNTENISGISNIKTDHLLQRQVERNISDEELQEAIKHGEKSVDREDGTIKYSHKNVVYVTSPDGVGITAYRLGLLQCICCSDHDGLEDQFDYYMHLDGTNKSRITRALEHISMGTLKANLTGCSYAKEVCVGAPCRVHRSTTDQLAMYLVKLPWNSEMYRGLLSHPDMIGYLILATAGSLLYPIRCDKCHGVKGLKRSVNPVDEALTIPWLQQLLDLAQKQEAGLKGKMEKKKKDGEWHDMVDDYAGLKGINYCNVHVAGGVTPLGAAAMAGNFRCTLELLKYGADLKQGLMSLHGPTANGHLTCFLLAKATSPTNVEFRGKYGMASYEECLKLLAYASRDGEGFCSISKEKNDKCIQFLKSSGLWDHVQSTQEINILGTVWDGTCHRFIWKGLCPCSDERCVGGATVVSSVGWICDAKDINKMVYDSPICDPVVLDFIKNEQAKATKQHCGEFCCCYSHTASLCMEQMKQMQGL